MISATLPLFLLIGFGFLLSKSGVFRQSWIKVLNSFVYYIALPAVIFVSITSIPDTLSNIIETGAYNILLSLMFALVTLLIVSILPATKKQKAVIFLTAITSNTVYLGIPLVSNVYSTLSFSEAIVDISVAAIVQLVFSIIFALIAIEFIFLRSRSVKNIVKRISKNPVVLTTVFSVFVTAFSLQTHIPEATLEPLRMLALTATPLALVALGAFLAQHHNVNHSYQLAVAVSMKLIMLPLLVILASLLFVMPAQTVGIATLMAGMPVAITAFVIAHEYKLDSQFVAVGMLLSTIASIVSLNVLIYVS